MSVIRDTHRLVNLLRAAAPGTPIYANAIGPENDPVPDPAIVYIESNASRAQNFQGSQSSGTIFRVQAHASDYAVCLALTQQVEQEAGKVRPKALITGSQGGYARELRLHLRELTVHIR